MRIDEFLLARIAEDEASASDLVDAWRGVRWLYGTRMEADYTDRWNPARALAECEAKRQIVAEHGRQRDRDWCRTCAGPAGREDDWPCATILTIANIYADHPDFNKDWRHTPV